MEDTVVPSRPARDLLLLHETHSMKPSKLQYLLQLALKSGRKKEEALMAVGVEIQKGRSKRGRFVWLGRRERKRKSERVRSALDAKLYRSVDRSQRAVGEEREERSTSLSSILEDQPNLDGLSTRPTPPPFSLSPPQEVLKKKPFFHRIYKLPLTLF